MKKLLLLFCFALLFEQSYAQKWDATFQGTTYNGSPFAGKNIIEYNGDLYTAGGWHSTLQTYIAKWDGTAWTPVGTGFSEYGAYLNPGGIFALEVFGGELYAAGWFQIDIGGTNHYNLIKWNAVSEAWEPVPGFPSTNLTMRVFDLNLYNGNLMIGGQFYGFFGGAVTIQNIIGYNGTNWVPFEQGFRQGAVFTMEVHNNELYIAGKFEINVATNAYVNKMVKWDESNGVWDATSPFQLFNNNESIKKIKSYGNHLYLSKLREDGNSWFFKFFRWDLSTEVTEISLVPGTTLSYVTNVYDMIVFDGNLIVAGQFWDQQTGYSSPIQIETYDGTSWNKALIGGASARALAVYNGKLTNGTLSYQDPSADFMADNAYPCVGESVTFSFTETSTNPITSFTWTFEGGTPATSTDTAPVVTWAANGNYNVSIEVTSADGTNTITKNNYIRLANDINITTQPVDVIECEGGSANFFIIKDFGNNTTMQWQVDSGTGFVDINGATNASYTHPSPLDNNGFKFRCKVTRCDNIVYSDEALLTVSEVPEVIQQPVTQYVCETGNAEFGVDATISTGTIAYQWQYRKISDGTYSDLADGGVYAGTTTKTLTLTGVDNTLAELYDNDNSDGQTVAFFKCLISANGCNSLAVPAVALSIYDPPTVTLQPVDIDGVCDYGSGVNTFFEINSSVNATYQWQVNDGSGFVNIINDVVYSGSNVKKLTLTGAPFTISGYQYRCKVGACTTPIYSDAATLSIDALPIITQQPIRANICDGSDATFTVEATGTNLTYQWQVSTGSTSNNAFTDITVNDATYFAFDGTLDISGSTMAMNNYRYRCVITSSACTINSGQGDLKIYSSPTIASNTPVSALTVCDGGTTILRLTTSGATNGFSAGVISFQWQSDLGIGVFGDLSDDIYFSGTNSNTLGIDSAVYAFNGYQFRCVIRGCTTENASEPETLTVLPLPTITESPQSQEVCSNGSVTFTAAATGIDVTYTWWRDTGDGTFSQVYGPKTTADYTFIADSSMDGYKFKCTAAPSGCTLGAESLEATLTIVSGAQITEQPQAQTVCANTEVTFSTTATGSALIYSWWQDNGNGSFAQVSSESNSPDYTFTANINQNGYYKCIIRAPGCGNSTTESEPALLTIGQTQISTTQDLINVCTGESAAFTVEATGVGDLNYQWYSNGTGLTDDNIYSGANTASLTVTGATTPVTNLLLTVSSDCGSTSLPFTLNVYGIERPEITPDFGNPNNPQLQVSTAFALGVDNFEWFLDGSSYQNSGSTTSITIDQAGSYTVIATKNDCQYPESEALVIVVTGFENNLSINSVSLYPNPVRNKLTLDLGSSFNLKKGAQIIVTNMSGQEVFNRNYNSLYNRRTQIDMSGYESGIYLVRVVGGGKMVQYKIRKQ